MTLFTEIADGIRSLDLRMGILTTRFEDLERDMLGAVEHLEHEINGTLPSRAEDPPRSPSVVDPAAVLPRLALMSDGRMLLHVQELEGRSRI